MSRLSLEYGRTYEIPVSFESAKITRRLLHGVIHVKERSSYLTIFTCNEDDLEHEVSTGIQSRNPQQARIIDGLLLD